MDEAPPKAGEPRVAFAGATDVGRQRKHNEDCLLIKAEHGLFCVADGMGGHNAGDVASKLVTSSLGNYFEATADGADQIETSDDYSALHPAARRLAAGVSKANRDVFTISSTHQQHHGMGSTCVAIHLAGGMVHIAHVGDSRCYRIRDGEMKQMTRDHSLINDALDMKPDLTKEELARLPKNIITRALGMKDGVKVDVKSEPLLPGDAFLLCSDGLTGMVPVDQILDVINLASEPQEACDLLIAEANDHGGTDNISAILVRIEDPAADEVDISAHAELDADEPDDVDLDGAEIVGAEIEIDADSERITRPASPQVLRPPPPPPVPSRPSSPGASKKPSVPPAPEAEAPPAVAKPSVPPAPRASSPAAVAPPAKPSVPPAPRPSAPGPAAPAPPVAPVLEKPRSEPPAVAASVDAGEALRAPEAPRVPVLEIMDEPPELEVGPDSGPSLDELITPEEAAALAAGGEIDLDLRGPWPGKVAVRRCAMCRHELFPGNLFCVECGARIDAVGGSSLVP